MTTPLPCPFCGELPHVYPKRPELEGDAFAQVRCENQECEANPCINAYMDGRGHNTILYKLDAIRRWNKRKG